MSMAADVSAAEQAAPVEAAPPAAVIESAAPPSDQPSQEASASASPTAPSEPPAPPSSSAPAASLDVPLPPAIPSPAPRRPKPPAKGILKPPPPPAKPTLSNRLRDIAAVVGGGAKSLFEPPSDDASGSTPGAGPSTPLGGGGTLNAISGRIGMGLSRLVAAAPSVTTPNGSPLPSRSISLPETSTGRAGSSSMGAEQTRSKQSLKRATFLLPSLSITYPISSNGEPWSQKVLADRKRIETTHRDLLVTTTGAQYWTSTRLVALYESACRGREERPRVGIIRALEVIPLPPKLRSIHIILRPFDPANPPPTSSSPKTLETPLNRHAAESLADVLTAEWGLMDLKLEAGAIDGDDVLKSILHALLVSGTLPTLSLAGNKKIRSGGWRLLAVFLKRARSLRYIDLSDTVWDKKGIDYLVQALTCTRVKPSTPAPPSEASADGQLAAVHQNGGHQTEEASSVNEKAKVEESADVKDSYGSFMRAAPLLKEAGDDSKPAAVQTLRMDGCVLRPNVLESLAQGIRSSDVKNISLRRNRIGPLGAVALALMIKDYPDSALTMSSLSPSLSRLSGSADSAPAATSDPTRSPSPLPYAARSRRLPVLSKIDDEASLPPIPMISSQGGVTSRTLPEGYKPPPPSKHPLVMPSGGNSSMQDASTASFSTSAEGRLTNPELGGASMALQRSVRALDGVERIGRLLTLDLKSNDIRNGVNYIAQVLKRNRTLKVLNLSDNRIDPAGLAVVAEALKYNSTLETLDLSSNPCCGPSSEGVAALRTAFTVNTSLKRLFLSDTGLTTDGAISLAEFLPESKSLLHLDITQNPSVDTAGILAISVGLRANTLIRCLDVSIPPNNPELAELSQNILQACIRNTESAAAAMKDGKTDGIWMPIKKSELVRNVKEADELRAEQQRVDMATSPEGMAREFVYKLRPDQVGRETERIVDDVAKWYEAGEIHRRFGGQQAWTPGQLPKEEFSSLLQKARVLRERLGEVIGDTTEAGDLERLLSLNDSLTMVIDRSVGFSAPPRLLLPSQIVSPQPAPQANGGGTRAFLSRRHMRVPSLEISSPNFSIGDSDNDSDPEELDVEDLPPSPAPVSVSTPSKELGGLGLGLDETALVDTSPVEKVNKAWIEEEGEIFRKGTRLGVVEDENDEDVSGEELKKEILETPVARSPTRRVLSVEESEGKAETEREGSPEE